MLLRTFSHSLSNFFLPRSRAPITVIASGGPAHLLAIFWPTSWKSRGHPTLAPWPKALLRNNCQLSSCPKVSNSCGWLRASACLATSRLRLLEEMQTQARQLNLVLTSAWL
nr:uncharacterized protein LOC113741826 [Coffea arabica]